MDVITASIERALDRLLDADQERQARATLETEIARLTTALGKLTKAIIVGGSVQTLVAAIQQQEGALAQKREALAGLDALRQVARLDVRHLEDEIVAALAEWTSFLARARPAGPPGAPEAPRDAVRVHADDGHGWRRAYAFESQVVTGRIIAGLACAKAWCPRRAAPGVDGVPRGGPRRRLNSRFRRGIAGSA